LLVLIPLVLGVGAGIATGGKIERWAEVRLRWPWLVVAALVVREAVALTPLGRYSGLRFVYVGFLVVLIGWTLWHATRVPGIWLIALGALMNLVVIAANDFRMPVAPAYADGLARVGAAGQYVLIGPDTRLSWMADWIGIAGGALGVYSVGDAVIAVGVGVASFAITRFPGSPTKLDARQSEPESGRE
jgi:Family of unknown function (DUF5317)